MLLLTWFSPDVRHLSLAECGVFEVELKDVATCVLTMRKTTFEENYFAFPTCVSVFYSVIILLTPGV